MSDIRLLLINPNSTKAMTDDLRRLYWSKPGLALEFLDGSGLPLCPAAIENATDSINSAAAVLPRALEFIKSNKVDGVLVCCFSDHPLVYILREQVDIPVFGIFHATLQTAWMLGTDFGIVTTALAWQPILTKSVRDAGMQERSVGVVSTGLGVLDLERLPRDHVISTIKSCVIPLVEKGAKSIILGCAGMSILEERLKEILPSDIEIIDGVKYGISLLYGLVLARK
ncbi:Asp/Glu/hydantoin racemase [Dipodascopsis uninucleata]